MQKQRSCLLFYWIRVKYITIKRKFWRL